MAGHGGSVLMERMRAEGDFKGFEPLFFTTSNVGGTGPSIGLDMPPLRTRETLQNVGNGHYHHLSGRGLHQRVHPKLRGQGFAGYWIDAASALRMKDEQHHRAGSCHLKVIKKGCVRAQRLYRGNCTVSLMLMAMFRSF